MAKPMKNIDHLIGVNKISFAKTWYGKAIALYQEDRLCRQTRKKIRLK